MAEKCLHKTTHGNCSSLSEKGSWAMETAQTGLGVIQESSPPLSKSVPNIVPLQHQQKENGPLGSRILTEGWNTAERC